MIENDKQRAITLKWARKFARYSAKQNDSLFKDAYRSQAEELKKQIREYDGLRTIRPTL